MNLYIVEARMAVSGGVFLPWDGKGHKTRLDATASMDKLAKKRHSIAEYDWRVVEYTPGIVVCSVATQEAKP